MATDSIVLADVLNLFEYEKVRDERRQRVLALKRARRVPVGRHLSFLFENRETVLFQIQEMCRAERIVEDAKIQEEIDVYSALLPRPRDLSATLMIEIEDKALIQPILDRFLGIDTGRHVWIEVGKELTVSAEFEPGHSDEERGKLSAVHFVRFAFPEPAVRAFAHSPTFLVVDHPAEHGRAEISGETKAALLEDLSS